MEPNNNDATPRENGHHPPSERGGSGEWTESDSYRGRMPPGYDEEWTSTSIAQRFAHGERAADVVESPTSEPVTVGEPQWYVTVRRDRFPQTNNTTAEYAHYVVPDIPALAAWFEADEDPDR